MHRETGKRRVHSSVGVSPGKGNGRKWSELIEFHFSGFSDCKARIPAPYAMPPAAPPRSSPQPPLAVNKEEKSLLQQVAKGGWRFYYIGSGISME